MVYNSEYSADRQEIFCKHKKCAHSGRRDQLVLATRQAPSKGDVNNVALMSSTQAIAQSTGQLYMFLALAYLRDPITSQV
jgi:hypothetical protein